MVFVLVGGAEEDKRKEEEEEGVEEGIARGAEGLLVEM
jgi:hypothetical protein